MLYDERGINSQQDGTGRSACVWHASNSVPQLLRLWLCLKGELCSITHALLIELYFQYP